jgi:UDPglucose 6-dehydrogenase
MKIGIVGHGFVGRATRLFTKNYYSNNDKGNDNDDNDDNEEKYEVLPDTVTTPAKSKSLRGYTSILDDKDDTQEKSSIETLTTKDNETTMIEGRTPKETPIPPFFKRIFFKPIEVLIYDINPNLCHPKGITLEQLDSECDLIFFCLPTPLNHDGSCYIKILEETISRCSNPYKIIRSTIPVGFAAKHRCYFMPEFLTEARWENDFYNNKEWIIGIPRESHETSNASTHIEDGQNKEFKQRITNLITRSHKNGSIKSNKIIFCDTNEAEMLKLMKNCFLSAKVGIMNEFFDFCNATNTDFKNVTDIAKLDARMGTSHFQVPGPDGRGGFGGTCFPKDTHSLYCQMIAKGIHPYIYTAVLERNDTHDRREREWASDLWRTTIPLPTPESKVVVVFTNSKEHSKYFDDIIHENLSKNNVVIQVIRPHQHDNYSSTSTGLVKPTNPNHLIKYWPEPSTAIFFPHVDECYYSPFDDTLAYQTIRDVMHIIDLWNSHEEMILYVVKNAKRVIDHIEANTSSTDDDSRKVFDDDESGTEGFDDDEYHEEYDPPTLRNTTIDYTKLFEDHYHNKFSRTQRKLVVMF